MHLSVSDLKFTRVNQGGTSAKTIQQQNHLNPAEPLYFCLYMLSVIVHRKKIKVGINQYQRVTPMQEERKCVRSTQKGPRYVLRFMP